MGPTPTRVLLACLLAAWAALIVSCGFLDYGYDVSGGYRVIRSSRDQVHIVPKRGWNDKTPRVPPKVIEVAWDERFVLAKQQHLKDGKPVWWTYSYWILDVTKPECFGPFTAEEFAAKRAELEVPAGLELRHVTSFIPKTEPSEVDRFIDFVLMCVVLIPLAVIGAAFALIALVDAALRCREGSGGRLGWCWHFVRHPTVAVAFVGVVCAALWAARIPQGVAVVAAALLVIRGAVVCVRQVVAYLSAAVSSWGG